MPICDKCSNQASRSKSWDFPGGHTTIWYCSQHLQSNNERRKSEIKF